MSATKEKIREFLLTWTKLDSSEELTYDYPIVERRVIDSMGLMSVVAFLENEFKVVIEPEDIAPEDFANITSIADLVDRLQGPK